MEKRPQSLTTILDQRLRAAGFGSERRSADYKSAIRRSAAKPQPNTPSPPSDGGICLPWQGRRAALSAPRSAALQHGQASAAHEVFRPLHAGGDAAARRPYLELVPRTRILET